MELALRSNGSRIHRARNFTPRLVLLGFIRFGLLPAMHGQTEPPHPILATSGSGAGTILSTWTEQQYANNFTPRLGPRNDDYGFASAVVSGDTGWSGSVSAPNQITSTPSDTVSLNGSHTVHTQAVTMMNDNTVKAPYYLRAISTTAKSLDFNHMAHQHCNKLRSDLNALAPAYMNSGATLRHLKRRALAPWVGLLLTIPVLGAEVASPSMDVAAIDRGRILRTAQAALEQKPITITQFPAKLSEGGPHDFYSNGDYWWPNPNTTNGLPYVQRDGQTNPENFIAHRRCVMQVRDAVAALGAAYRLTGDDRYVAQAAELLRVFFVDQATRMNPSLKFAQAIPGITPGRGIGIIDTLHLIEIPLAVRAMEQSAAFPPFVLAGVKQWFSDYTEWMTTSKNGQDEANTKNNHAVAFWLQVACFSELTGDEAQLNEGRRRFKEIFVGVQMARDGSFPQELRRTKPYGYSIFQLDNLASLAQLLSTHEENLWLYELPDGRGMRQAMAYLYPFLADKSKWPLKPDIQAWEGWPARQPCLLFAGLALGEQKYLDLWRRLPADPTDAEVKRNLAITQPLLWLR